jgi:hypothetical protein
VGIIFRGIFPKIFPGKNVRKNRPLATLPHTFELLLQRVDEFDVDADFGEGAERVKVDGGISGLLLGRFDETVLAEITGKKLICSPSFVIVRNLTWL